MCTKLEELTRMHCEVGDVLFQVHSPISKAVSPKTAYPLRRLTPSNGDQALDIPNLGGAMTRRPLWGGDGWSSSSFPQHFQSSAAREENAKGLNCSESDRILTVTGWNFGHKFGDQDMWRGCHK